MMDAHAAAFPAALTGISHPLSTASSPVTEHPLSYKLTSLALYRLSSTEHKNTISNNEMRQTLFPDLWSSFLDNHTALKTNDLLPVFLRNYLLVEPDLISQVFWNPNHCWQDKPMSASIFIPSLMLRQILCHPKPAGSPVPITASFLPVSITVTQTSVHY